MVKLKLLLLPVAGCLGLWCGAFVEPSQILFPAAPTAKESMLIHYIEMHSNLLYGLFSAFCVFAMAFIVKSSVIINYLVVVFIGAVFGLFSYWRMGVWVPSLIPSIIGAYSIGILAGAGIVDVTLSFAAKRKQPD